MLDELGGIGIATRAHAAYARVGAGLASFARRDVGGDGGVAAAAAGVGIGG